MWATAESRWLVDKYDLRTSFAAALVMVVASTTDAGAQQGVLRVECAGYVNGVASQASLEITPGAVHKDGPGVAGRIENQFANYLFNGTLFGGAEGFVQLVELRTGERIDRVWIGWSQLGFALRTEDGAVYPFQCRS
jgi:hypothetical protein